VEYKYSDITGGLINAAMEVHRELGNNFPEIIYQRAFENELTARNVFTVSREFEMPVFYKGQLIGKRRVDFLINNIIAVELKATPKLEDVHLAQALNYLEIFNIEIGLLINFGGKSLEFKRLYNKRYKP